MKNKIVLIDGHSILNRAFYGVPELTNLEGLHTNGIYGFLNIMFKILEEEKPDYLCVAFDVKAPTFRHKIYDAYKGTRKPMPAELHEQVPVLKEVLQAMQIKTMEQAGLEADDILGTLAKKSELEGMEVTLVSGDRDLLQIASEHIKIRIPKSKGGKTETEDYYTQDVINKYQVDPIAFIELKALMGDTADNIPGVPKVGEKTATELMVQYGSLSNIYEHLEEISKKSIRESLRDNKALADLSKTLATIKTDCTLDFSFEEAKIKDFYTQEAYQMFKKLAFKNLLLRFQDTKKNQNDLKQSFIVIQSLEEFETMIQHAKTTERISYFFFKDKTDKTIAALSLAISEDEVYIVMPNGLLTGAYITESVNDLVEQCRMISFCCKDSYQYFKLTDTDSFDDILIAAYLLNPLKNDYTMEDIASEHLGMLLKNRVELLEKCSFRQAIEEKQNAFMEYAGTIAQAAFLVYPVLMEKLKESGMQNLYRSVEMPLSLVLFQMEQEGILVDQEELTRYGKSLLGRISELEQLIYQKANMQFNINSPKQLGEVLFEKMMLPGGKKTKTGYSTAADVLEKLADDYPIVSDILEYRTLAKLKSTYADGLFNCIGEDGRIHTTFNQTITATGRISSTEPNLQNIPIRMELGRQIRKAFIPKKGYLFMDADYSQIELRLLAHMSHDMQLIEAYRQDEDIHRITASKVFHTPLNEVTQLQRRNAKAVNFGIVYGISSFGLSQGLSINKKEAEKYIQDYFSQYPQVKEFLDNTVEMAENEGYVTTLYGRRRPIPELHSSNFMQRSFGKRVAMNSPIQGTAADIMKIAMIHVSQKLKEKNLSSKILIQVHDELLLEVKESEQKEVEQILTEEMRNAADLLVSLEVDVHTGKDWYEAK